jgi:uncharacterized protein involved in outer membrane biogenesis
MTASTERNATAPILQKSPPPKTGQVVKRIAATIGLLMVLIIAALALAPSSFWRWLIIREASHATGRTASIDGDVKVHLFSLNPSVVVEGFALSNAQWAKPKDMLRVKRFEATLSLKSLLGFHLIFPRVAIDSPGIDFERDASGRANWDFSGDAKKSSQASSAPLHLPVIQQLSLTNGTLTASDRIRKLTFNGQVSVLENQANSSDNHALKLRGSGTLNAKPFELKLDGEPLIGVQPTKPYGFEAAVAAADIKLNAHATISHPFDMAALQAAFHLTGSDLADVYYLTGLALPNTPPYDVSGTLIRDNLKFRIDEFQGKLGSSDVSGKLGIDTGRERPKLTATLNSKQLNLADLAAPLGAQATPERKSDTLARPSGAPAAAPPAPAPPPKLLLPDADLQVQRVRGMDADVQFDAASVMTSKMPMKKVRFHLNLDNGKITVNPLDFQLSQGDFSGSFAVDAQGATPVTSIDMKLINVDLAQFKPKPSTTAPFEGQLLGRIKIQGSGSSVHKTAATANGDVTLVIPKGEMREALAELTGIDLARGLGLMLTKNEQNTELRCGVASFKADGGDLKATTFVLDTTHMLVTAEGDINLANEALNLSLRGQPKQARLLRLRTPITLRGSLSQPKIGVDPGKLAAQTGGAVALGALLTPVAAVLAFVDGGLAKDANCAALLGQAQQGKNLPQ